MNRKELGNKGEGVAVDYLKANGFKVIERNFRCRMGEIDVVVKKDGELFFVEVKTRSSDQFGDPLEAITYRKQRQVVKIAKLFLLKYEKKEVRCHFSALGIKLTDSISPSIKFIPDAFTT